MMNELTKEQLLAEARERLRGIAAHMVERFGAEDVAAIWLTQALALQGLYADKEACAAWLRQLAREVESCGTIDGIDPKTLN
jgi:hypothetical protein